MTEEEVRAAIDVAAATDHFEMTRHFWDELRADAFVLADVRCAVVSITEIVDLGVDGVGNPKFEVTGAAADGRRLALVCSFKGTGAVLLISSC